MVNYRQIVVCVALASLGIFSSCSDSDFSSGQSAAKNSDDQKTRESEKEESSKTKNSDGSDDDLQDDLFGDDDGNGGDSGGDVGDDTDLSQGQDADSDQDLVLEDGEAELTEEELKKSLPGVEVQRVGVNFEDLVNGDFDFNDAVFCFTGVFKLDGANAVSYKEQTVNVALTNRSGQNHNYEIYVLHDDGTKGPIQTGQTDSPQPIALQFQMKSKLFVQITTEAGLTFAIDDNVQTQVLADQCNVDGD